VSDFDALAAKLGRQVAAIGQEMSGSGQRSILTKVSVEAKKDVDKEVVASLGGDRKFSNWGVRFGSGFEVVSDSRSELKPRPLGPWLVLEKGRKGKAAAYPRGRRRRKVYRTPWGPRVATQANPWRSGKTAGRKVWTKAGKPIVSETPKRFRREINKGLLRALRK